MENYLLLLFPHQSILSEKVISEMRARGPWVPPSPSDVDPLRPSMLQRQHYQTDALNTEGMLMVEVVPGYLFSDELQLLQMCKAGRLYKGFPRK